ncbi:Eif-2-Alpha Kinase Activator Gcn1 [Manis pentadactyla]|nr:Eif-2-Alpha Kinase Activator Gcn1 [Manis pentadactyla]
MQEKSTRYSGKGISRKAVVPLHHRPILQPVWTCPIQRLAFPFSVFTVEWWTIS